MFCTASNSVVQTTANKGTAKMVKKISDQDFITAWKTAGGGSAMARATGLDLRGIMDRRKSIETKYGVILEGSKPAPKRSKAHVEKIGSVSV